MDKPGPGIRWQCNLARARLQDIQDPESVFHPYQFVAANCLAPAWLAALEKLLRFGGWHWFADRAGISRDRGEIARDDFGCLFLLVPIDGGQLAALFLTD